MKSQRRSKKCLDERLDKVRKILVEKEAHEKGSKGKKKDGEEEKKTKRKGV